MATYPNDWATVMQPVLRQWVVSALSGLVAPANVVWSHQDGPSPAKPLARIYELIPPVVQGQTVSRAISVSPTEMMLRVESLGALTIEVEILADDPTTATTGSMRLRPQQLATLTRDAIKGAGLAPRGEPTITDTSLYMAGQREYRRLYTQGFFVTLRTDLQNQPHYRTVDPATITVLEG